MSATHTPCDSCGSSDGRAVYHDHSYCFVCQETIQFNSGHQQKPMTSSLIPPSAIDSGPLSSRCLTGETVKHWGYGTSTINGQPCQIATYRDADGTPVAQKIRFKGKKFIILGDAGAMGLYGQHLWRDGGKRVIITEGEIDALSMSQAQGNKYPVVSLPNGAAGAKKAIQGSLEWLEKFEIVVLMFDNDEPGRLAALECADILSPGKCRIATLPLKDANEMLKANRGSELIALQWAAKEHRPDGIINGNELWNEISSTQQFSALPYPYPTLQHMTEGARETELICFTAGSGIGKSEVVRQIYYSWFMSHHETVGLIHLEEPVKKSSLALMGLWLKRRINRTLGRDKTTPDELKAAFDATVGNGRVYFYQHFGSSNSDTLTAKIRYFAKGLNCKTVVLDHVSMVISGVEDGDERRMLDNLMTKLTTLAQELSCRIIIICHLKRKEGTPFNAGGEVSLTDMRGSAAVEQLSHTVIALERNQQDEKKKHWTRIRLLKCRETGETGTAGWLRYNPETGWLDEGVPQFEESEDIPF